MLQIKTVTNNSNLKDEKEKERISEVVRKLFQDSKGNIWFGTQGGAFKVINDSLIPIPKIKSESGGRVTIKDITEDKNGKIWLGHTDGISCVDGDKVINYYQSDGLISNDVWCIEADIDGRIWIGTIKGACIFDGNEFQNFELPEGEIDTTRGISSKRMIHNIFRDSKGIIWLSTNAGLFLYSSNKLSNESERLGIQTNFINEICEDGRGIIWVSTKEALYKLNKDKASNITKEKIEIGKGIGSVS